MQGELVMAKSRRLELGDSISGHCRSNFNHFDVAYLASKATEIGENCKRRAITPFKVIEVGTNRKPVCDFLLVINSRLTDKLYHAVAELSQFIVQILDNAFLSHSLGGLRVRDNVRCSSRAHCKARKGVLIELFSLDVTAEALRAKTYRKSAISLQRGQFEPKFQVETDVPTNNFCMDS